MKTYYRIGYLSPKPAKTIFKSVCEQTCEYYAKILAEEFTDKIVFIQKYTKVSKN